MSIGTPITSPETRSLYGHCFLLPGTLLVGGAAAVSSRALRLGLLKTTTAKLYPLGPLLIGGGLLARGAQLEATTKPNSIASPSFVSLDDESQNKLAHVATLLHDGKVDEATAAGAEIIATGNATVFALPQEFPDVVFKGHLVNHKVSDIPVNAKDDVQLRAQSQHLKFREAQNRIARGVCKRWQLDHLLIPDTQLIEVTVKGIPTTLMAERRVEISPSYLAWEHELEQASQNPTPEFEQAMYELGRFIVETRFNDVDPRNIPLVQGVGGVQIALVDLESCDSAEEGLAGGSTYGARYNDSEGLIHCISPELASRLIPLLPSEYAQSASRALEKRQAFWVKKADIERFHEDHGITAATSTIDVDFATLDIPDATFTLGADISWTNKGDEVARYVVEAINDGLSSEADPKASLRRQRTIVLLKQTPNAEGTGTVADKLLFGDEQVSKVLEALKQQGCVYEYEARGSDFRIQL